MIDDEIKAGMRRFVAENKVEFRSDAWNKDSVSVYGWTDWVAEDHIRESGCSG